MEFLIKEISKFKFIDTEGENKPVLLLLHGLFGELSNFDGIINKFNSDYRVVIPILPLVDMPIRQIGLTYIVNHVTEFVEYLDIKSLNILGNSLGGHIAQLYVLDHPERVDSLILTGSSGLFENSFGGSFLRRNDYKYIEEKVKLTFYDPKIANKEMVDRVFAQVNDRNSAIRLVGIAKSAIKHNLENLISKIEVPTLLIWGKDDTITPPFVANKFKDLIPNSELKFIGNCGHAPMMETPEEFNVHLGAFLSNIYKKTPVSI